MGEVRPSFRFATPADVPGLEKLWLGETEWGMPPEFLQRETAGGDFPLTLIAVNEADGEILGQCGFVSMAIKVGDRLVNGVRPHSTIVSKTYSGSIHTLDLAAQPAVALYANGLRHLKDAGYKLAYMLPHPRWSGLFRLQPRAQMASFPLYSLELPLQTSLSLPAECTVSEIDSWDDSIDDLWKRWAPQYDCGLVRTASVLKWKASLGPNHSIAVRHGNDLIGIVMSRPKGDRMWMISDILTVDDSDSLRSTLIAGILDGVAFRERQAVPPEQQLRKVSILALPRMAGLLDELGFFRDDWKFPLVVERLDDSLSAEQVAPEKWYVTASD